MSLFLDLFFKKKSARKHGLGLIFSFIFYQEKIKKVISELYFLNMGDPGSKTGKRLFHIEVQDTLFPEQIQ